MKRTRFLLATLCGAALLSGFRTPSIAAETNVPNKELKLALVSNTGAEYWRLARAGCYAAMKELGNVQVEFRINQSGDAAGQLRVLKEVMAQRPDGVAVSVNSVFQELDELNTIASQTLLLCFDSDASPSKRACYVGTDNVAAGVQAGNMIRECLPKGGKIMLFVGNRQAQNSIQRQVGIVRALEESNIEIVDVLTDDTDRLRAQKNIRETLLKHPDIGCLVGLWSYEGPAILETVRGADRIGKVKIVCFDDQPETLAGVRSGAIYGTVVQDPFEIGRQTVLIMDKYLRGDKAAFGESKKIHVPTRQIKQDNVAAYLEERQKLLN